MDAFFAWCEQQLQDQSLLPDNSFVKAIGYMRNRQDALRVFLEDPAVPLDTNHLERGLRPILTPRIWQQKYADAPMRSDLYLRRQ